MHDAYDYLQKKLTKWCMPTELICGVSLVGHTRFCQTAVLNLITNFYASCFHFGNETGIQLFSSPYYPQGNGHIENVHNFLKMCIQKHVFSELAWDEVVHIACANTVFSKLAF